MQRLAPRDALFDPAIALDEVNAEFLCCCLPLALRIFFVVDVSFAAAAVTVGVLMMTEPIAAAVIREMIFDIAVCPLD
jgi:hypothetical protein